VLLLLLFVFGDPVADEILRALRTKPAGMTRTDISGLFGRHKEAANQIEPALNKLLAANLARCEIEKTGGRSAERWYAVTATKRAKSAKSEERHRSADLNSHNSLILQNTHKRYVCPRCGGDDWRDYGDGPRCYVDDDLMEVQ
jgi:hypothetical protein